MTEGPPAWELLLDTPWMKLGMEAHICNQIKTEALLGAVAEAGLLQL